MQPNRSDLARFKQAVARRERCVREAREYAARIDMPLSETQARVAYDAMASIIYNAGKADAQAEESARAAGK